MAEEKTIIEINGIKMEVDLRHATRVEEFKIGSKVKVLKKQYENHKVYHGVIVGFDQFKELPTIIVAYLDITYSETKLEFAYINAETENVELVLAIDDTLPINRADVLQKFETERSKLQHSLEELDRKQGYFERHFQLYFNDFELNEGKEVSSG